MLPQDADTINRLTPEQRVALTLWGEGRGGSGALRSAIASVIVNRVRAQQERWGLTAADVCLKRGQFSCWDPKDGAENYAAVVAEAQKLLAGEPVGPVMRTCLSLAQLVLDGTLPDSTHGATSYYSPAAMVPRGRVPDWAVGQATTAFADGTRFYAV